MKRHLLLVGLLFIVTFAFAGCGSVRVGQDQATEKGTITLTFKPNGSMRDGTMSSQLVPVEATNVRVRIFNSSGANIVEDAAIPTSDGSVVSLAVSLPADTYSVHVIAYKASSGRGIVLTGGSADGVVVQSGVNSQVTISLSKWLASFTVPTEPIQGGSSYDVTFTIDDHHEFSYELFYFLSSQNAWTDNPASSSNDYSFLSKYWQAKYPKTAPSVSTQTTVYYQVNGWLDYDKYWRTGLPCKYLHLFFPSSTAGASLGTITVRPPDGGVIIGLE